MQASTQIGVEQQSDYPWEQADLPQYSQVQYSALRKQYSCSPTTDVWKSLEMMRV